MSYQPYDPNVPEFSSDTLNVSQPQLLNNFIKLAAAFSKNHGSLPLGDGNHTIVQLLQLQNAFQTDLSELAVYSKNVEGQTDQVFLRYQSQGQEIQFTTYQIYSVNNTQFFTFLPGSIIVYFGTISGGNTVFRLVPPVAKHIITTSFCPVSTGTTGFVKPYVSLIEPVNGFITGIQVNYFFQAPATTSHYLVMANI